MKCIVLETPYAGDVEANVAFARECVKACLIRGEAAIASHLLYTQPGLLDDNVPEQRALGIEAGHVWIEKCDYMVVYSDRGISPGMHEGIRRAKAAGKAISFRRLYGYKNS